MATSTGAQRSSRLTSLRAADVLLELPQGTEELKQLAKDSVVTGLLMPA